MIIKSEYLTPMQLKVYAETLKEAEDGQDKVDAANIIEDIEELVWAEIKQDEPLEKRYDDQGRIVAMLNNYGDAVVEFERMAGVTIWQIKRDESPIMPAKNQFEVNLIIERIERGGKK